MLPDMSEVLIEWEQPVKLKTVTTETVDFEGAEIITVDTIKVVVQPADKTKLQIDSLDWSKEYVLIHKRGTGIEIGQFVEWQGRGLPARDFKVIGPNGLYQDYGFIELVGESTNRPVLVAT